MTLAQKFFRTLPMESGSTSIDWRDEADRAEAAIECGDGATALKLASRAICKFETMIDCLARDADRVAACDDVSAASLYLLLARIHLRLARAVDRRTIRTPVPPNVRSLSASPIGIALSLCPQARGRATARTRR